MTLHEPIRVVIACIDVNLGGALASLATAGNLEVVAVVDSMRDLTTEVRKGSFDVLAAFASSGFTPQLVIEASLGLPVLIVGPVDDPLAMIDAVEAGALGYADADASLEDVVDAIRSVGEGVAVIPPLLLGSLLRHVVERQRTQRRARERLRVLSSRERQVFELTARGLDRGAVAAKLFISPATVRTHVQNTFRKLDLHSLAELVALAAECGLELSTSDQRRLV